MRRFNILGAWKTGTSTIVGLLNCHPDIFCFYEFSTYEWARKRSIVGGKELIKQNIQMVKSFKLKKYKWVGDKNPLLLSTNCINQMIEFYKDRKIIFAYRKVESWLCHKSIQRRLRGDVRGLIYRYLYYFVKSHELKDCLHIRLDLLLDSPSKWVNKISKHFGVNPDPMYKWWNRVGLYKDENKCKYKWWVGHSCAVQSPQVDIVVKTKPHPMWGVINKVMNDPTSANLELFWKLNNKPILTEHIIKHYTHTKISSMDRYFKARPEEKKLFEGNNGK
jgi:hypothetical protein